MLDIVAESVIPRKRNAFSRDPQIHEIDKFVAKIEIYCYTLICEPRIQQCVRY